LITTSTARRKSEAHLCRYVYWLAIFVPADPWADAARAADISDTLLITTEEVLSEFLTAVCGRGDYTRTLACRLVREILNDPAIEVVVQSHDSFLAGLALYERRADKAYSLTDCISMNVMRQQRIHEVLTHDGHFAQEGFTLLLGR
jgi:predicted nucleic acid-binding protein